MMIISLFEGIITKSGDCFKLGKVLRNLSKILLPIKTGGRSSESCEVDFQTTRPYAAASQNRV